MNEELGDIKINALIDSLNAPSPIVVALEGGPCGGKTSVMYELEKIQDSLPRDLVLLDEVATKNIAKDFDTKRSVMDLSINNRQDYISFQSQILKDIVNGIFESKKSLEGKDSIIVTDRADIGAYVEYNEYQFILNQLGYAKPPILDMVDKVIYLPTLAKLDPGKYLEKYQSNTSRYENSIAQAVETCDRNLIYVSRHPELSIHTNKDFKALVKDVISEILNPEAEIEAKYIPLKFKDNSEIKRYLDNRCLKLLGSIAIKQSYHISEGQEYRLRQVTAPINENSYFYSTKTTEGSVRREHRRIIDNATYTGLRKAPMLGELNKTRYRYLFELNSETREQTILCADFYQDRPFCMIEVEGIGIDKINEVYLPGFSSSNMSARELI